MVIPGAMLTVLFILDARLALIALLPIPLTAFLVFRYVSRVRGMWAGVRGGLGDLVAQVQDYLSGVSVINRSSRKSAAPAASKPAVRPSATA